MSVTEDLAGQAIVVAGLAGGWSAALAQGLAARRAQVVVIGAQADALLAIAASDPARIETLCMALDDAAGCAQVAAIWQATPLAALVNCLPLETSTDAALAGVETLVTMLGAGIGAGAGLLVTVCPDGPTAPVRAMRAAHLHQATLLRPRLARLGARVATLPLSPGIAPASLVPVLACLLGPDALRVDGAVIPLTAAVSRKH